MIVGHESGKGVSAQTLGACEVEGLEACGRRRLRPPLSAVHTDFSCGPRRPTEETGERRVWSDYQARATDVGLQRRGRVAEN